MKTFFSKVLAFLGLASKKLLSAVASAVLARAKEQAQDSDLLATALAACQAAAKEGLTGEKAWVEARDRLTTALRATGRTLADTAIDTALQTTYDAWKSLGKPQAEKADEAEA